MGAFTGAKSLRVLLVEDSEADAELLVRALRRAGYTPDYQRVETREAMASALDTGAWDIVISDFSMPQFDAPSALETLTARGIDVPFLVVSGTVDEETAVAAMRQGVHDYLSKGRLARLGAAVERELKSAAERAVRRKAEEALRRSEERFRLLVEHSSDFVAIVDEDGAITYASPSVERMLGWAPGELIGTQALDLAHCDDRQRVKGALAAVAEAPRATATIEARYYHRDGSARFVEAIVQNRLDDPVIRGIVAATRDVHHRQVVEVERRARVQAELASKTKSGFLANMSHELRTPLNAIIGFTELMDQGIAGPLSERQRTYVQTVLQAGRHLLTLVNDVLDLSKIEAGRMNLARDWTSLPAVAAAVRDVVQPLAEEQGISVEVAIPESHPQLYVDPTRLRQILYNLVANGIKFTPRGGQVRVSAHAENNSQRIVVEDTGIGIRPEDMPRLFREFEQVDSSSGERPAGTGLGLVLTKRLVEMHGGAISARSEYGKGTAFTVTLQDIGRPALSGQPPSLPLEKEPHATVLVVEDDPRAADLIAGHLVGGGVSVIRAETAEEALRVAAIAQPAAITLDIRMPGIDGWAILGYLKKEPATARIPVLVISVDDDVSRARELGAAGHLTKPISREVLHDLLCRLELPIRTVVGARVLVVGEGSDLQLVAESLGDAGCEIERRAALASEAVIDAADIAIVDWTAPANAVSAEQLLTLRSSHLPVLGIVQTVPARKRAGISYLARDHAHDPGRLVWSVATAITASRLRAAGGPDPKAPPVTSDTA